MTMDVEKYAQTIDSRDVISKVEELEDELEQAKNLLEELKENAEANEADINDLEGQILDIEGDLAPIKEFDNDGALEFGPAWEDGVYLISDDYFEEFAEEFAKDIGAISSDFQWPLNCINWQEAADELKQDYSSIEFDGYTFWGRE